MHALPVPSPAWNFGLPRWSATDEVAVDCRAIDCRAPIAAASMTPARGEGHESTATTSTSFPRTRLRSAFLTAARRSYKKFVRPLLPGRIEDSLSAAIHAAAGAWRRPREFPTLERLLLSGVVY